METVKIRCKTLCVGDWVANRNGSPMQIVAVDEDNAYACEGNNAYACEGNEERPWIFGDDEGYEPQPIELTPEILEKNKFLPSFEMGHETLCLVSSEYSVYYRPVDTYLYVFKRDNEHGEGNFIVSDHRNKNAKYVHELQRALRLCGLNELADNFKL